ncbi:MAG TPA: preprotein translocase subunit YajC [Propionicimonas sp.]|jgi:preprotein translocase subunit YajC|nr:preprotein translocase subunit YajC [Propionicimonas sp.]
MPGFDPTTILLLLGVVALAYFMLIRPQQKRAKEQRDLMAALKAGDRVMTISGIVGTIRYLGEKQAIIEISPGVEMTVVKAAISSQPVDDEFEYSDEGSVGDSDPVDLDDAESTDTDDSAGEDQSK